jgi:hypothetical protein
MARVRKVTEPQGLSRQRHPDVLVGYVRDAVLPSPTRSTMKSLRSWTPAACVLAAFACSGGGGGGSNNGGNNNPTSPTSNVPVSVAKQSGDIQTGTVGATIAAPVVKVLNFSGAGVAGVVVTFTASGGDVLGATSATTGSDGTASAGSWKLSTVAGAHSVSASAAGVAIPAAFSATANADVAKTLTKSAGDNQTGFQSVALGTKPAVTVTDQYGNAVAGTQVTFAVASGGGSVTGPTQVTTSVGVATVGNWILGSGTGANTLTATTNVAGIAPVTFTATAIVDPCATANVIAVGQTLNGTLTANDCLFADDYYADIYAVNIVGTQMIQMDLQSTAFDPWLDLGDANDAYWGYNDNAGGGTSPRLRLLGPAGEYLAIANSFASRATGAYTFGLSAWSGDVANCESDVWIVPRAAAYAQTLAATDCTLTFTTGSHSADGIYFWASAGKTYTFTMASTAVDPQLVIRALSSTGTVVTVGQDDNSGGGTTARVTWTSQTETVGIIFATTALPTTAGAYTLTVTSTGGTAAAVGASRLPARARAIRLPAFAKAGALSAYWPKPGQTTVRAPRRP